MSEVRMGAAARLAAVALSAALAWFGCSCLVGCGASGGVSSASSPGQGASASTASAESSSDSQQSASSSASRQDASSPSSSSASLSAIPADHVLNPDDFVAMTEAGSGAVIMDTRSRVNYFSIGFAWESVNIPANQVSVRSREVLDFADGILLVASDAKEADQVYADLGAMGYDFSKVWVLEGGVAGWMASGYEMTDVEFRQLGC